MNTNTLISRFIAQLCEKQYAYANSTLSTIIEKKIKAKIKKAHDKMMNLDKKDKKNNKNKKMSKMNGSKNK